MGLGSRPQGRYKYQQESIPPGRATCEKPEQYAARGKNDAGQWHRGVGVYAAQPHGSDVEGDAQGSSGFARG